MKSWIATYLEYTDHLEAPREFQLWSAVSAIAATLQRKVWVHMGEFQWYPNFYIILIAEPGILQKTTTIDRAYNLVRDCPFADPEVGGVFFGPSSTTWQSFITTVGRSLVEVPNPDKTGENVASASISLPLGELGTFMDTSEPKMTDNLVDLWDCRRIFEKSTKTSGDDVLPYPFVNILAGTTPGWIRTNFPRYMIQGGFTSRTIFALAHEKKQLCPYPHRATPPKEHKLLRMKLIDGLCRMYEFRGVIPLTEEAYVFGERWYEEHYNNPPIHLTTELMRPYHSRKQAHLHKLAMILAISDIAFGTGAPEITDVHLRKSLEILNQQEQKFLQAVAMMGEAASMQAVADIKAYVKKEKRVRNSTLLRHFGQTYPLKDIIDACKFNNQAREFLSIWDQNIGELVHSYPFPGRKE